MNLTNIRKAPVLAAVGCGVLGMTLRLILYRVGFDDKGILSSSHPLHITCLVLTLAVTLYLAVQVRKLPENTDDRPLVLPVLGLAAGGLQLVQALLLWQSAPVLMSLPRCFLAAAAGIAMVVCVFSGQKSRNIASVCHGIICAAFAADMLGRYRGWSGNPQLPDYVFHVLSGVVLSLCAYQTLALHTGLGKAKLQKF